jgi:hypothetical protein
LGLLAVIGSGCARTVTPVVTLGEELRVTVTLRGGLDINNNRYFMVLSDSANYAVPLPPPDIIEAAPEFIEPGDTPLTGSEEAYYTNFYSTWDGYIVLDPAGYSLVRGPFVINQAATREVLAELGDINNTLSFSFRLERMFTAVPDRIYFDVIAVSWPDGTEKIPQDHLPSANNYISKVSGSIQEVNDGEDLSLVAGLDIIGCRLEVE